MPQSHPEVVNRQPRTLIVGYGHVGQQIGRYFTEADWVDEHNIICRVADNEVADVTPHWAVGGSVVTHLTRNGEPFTYDLAFICVPTPEGEGGRCDTSLVRCVYHCWNAVARYWCIKSTVEVGTTASLGGAVCFSPEYYGETLGHPLAGAPRDTFVILGGPRDVTRVFAEAWTLVTNSYTRIYQTDSRTAELCKLAENAWIATKVTFCSDLRRIAENAHIDWHELRELWLADPRISRSHTYAYADNPGWAGKCIPKDTANLCAWTRALGQPARLLEAVREVNRAHRE